jgi:hypothetical protein
MPDWNKTTRWQSTSRRQDFLDSLYIDSEERVKLITLMTLRLVSECIIWHFETYFMSRGCTFERFNTMKCRFLWLALIMSLLLESKKCNFVFGIVFDLSYQFLSVEVCKPLVIQFWGRRLSGRRVVQYRASISCPRRIGADTAWLLILGVQEVTGTDHCVNPFSARPPATSTTYRGINPR